MKIKSLIFISLGLLYWNSINAQNVPNGGFETWEMKSLYEQPDGWITANQETFMMGMQTALKVEDSYSGTYALRLETAVSGEDTAFGYAFSGGTIIGGGLNDTLRFQGGFPVSSAPDTLFCYMKGQTSTDSAVVLVSFKKNGNYIGQNVYFVQLATDVYEKFAFEILPPSDVPDTAIVAFASTDPDNPSLGGYLQVDSLWFGNLPDVIPNADFENWTADSYQEPAHWVTANLFSHLFGGGISATPTVDAYSGSQALRLEAVQTYIPGEEGLSPGVTGFGMAYGDVYSLGGDMPRFPVDFNPSSLTGYYKFTPAIDDTAIVFVGVFDTAGNSYENGTLLFPASEYTQFTIPLTYPSETIITEASVIVSTSTHFFEAGPAGAEEGSVLILDDLTLVDPCESFAPYDIASVTQATCDDITAILDAGDGWDEYYWSNDSTTQVIQVEVTEDVSYSVTVRDDATGCQFTAEANLIAPVNCEEAVETAIDKTPSFSVYPNPASGKVSFSFKNMDPATYDVELMSITGRIVKKGKFTTSQRNGNYSMDVSSCSPGIYLLKVNGNTLNHCERILIK